MRSIILAVAAIGLALACAVFFYSSDCPEHTFIIGSSMVSAGSIACDSKSSEASSLEQIPQ
jgi:hypothetical protein